ncbi:MAG: cytochrome c biogenesis protein CcdA [Candidatus Woesearchaeota archaeon]
MVSVFVNLWLSFIAGLFAPLVAVCVLPLYPGFLSYLAGQISQETEDPKKLFIKLGLIVTAGVITSMFVFGLIFTALLQESLTKAIGIVSPIAFGILAVVSLLLIFNVDFGKIFPKINAPVTKNPYFTSFVFGFFFGAIVLPCNPASLAVLFAISTSTMAFIANLFNFILFGVGMAAPLLIFSIISATKSQAVITFLTDRKRPINLIAGLIMLGISLYYLIFVFRIFGG